MSDKRNQRKDVVVQNLDAKREMATREGAKVERLFSWVIEALYQGLAKDSEHRAIFAQRHFAIG